MADITAAIRDHLKDDAGVIALMGDRIRRGQGLPKDRGTTYAVLRSYNESPNPHQTGQSDLRSLTVEASIFAKNRGLAQAGSDAIIAALDQVQNESMGDAGVSVRVIEFLRRAQSDVLATDGAATGEYQDIVEFTVWYRTT